MGMAALISRRLFLLATPVSWADGVRGESGDVTVTITDYTFRPERVAVMAGSRVTWLNADDVPHSVVHAGHPHLFRSTVLFPGQRFVHQFMQAGEFQIRCGINRHMRGLVVVA